MCVCVCGCGCGCARACTDVRPHERLPKENVPPALRRYVYDRQAYPIQRKGARYLVFPKARIDQLLPRQASLSTNGFVHVAVCKADKHLGCTLSTASPACPCTHLALVSVMLRASSSSKVPSPMGSGAAQKKSNKKERNLSEEERLLVKERTPSNTLDATLDATLG